MNHKLRKKLLDRLALAGVAVAVLISLTPVYWILATSTKRWTDIFSTPPRFVYRPTAENYKNLMTLRSTKVEGGREVLALSDYPQRMLNSVVIAAVSTVLAVSLGTLTAYGFSRFEMRGKGDLLFFILSTRMLPPVVVVIPLFLMYRSLGLTDTHLGLILLYTAFNVSFAVWLMKGFIDEIPREYEEAALVDGYTRLEAFRKVVLPQAATGIAATAVFCLISAWNEFAFALIMTTMQARTAPPSIVMVVGSAGLDWGQIAAGTFLFLLPVVVFTFAVRRHLLRGITFGAIRR